jgi:predicted nuclease of predicted toxin-antitoxin system
MKLKLDENLGQRASDLLSSHGHDVSTVSGQGLCSASDRTLIEVCRTERRCIVTLDLDFGNPLLFKPSEYEGIVVLRLPPKPSHDDLIDGVSTLLGALAKEEVKGMLWVVQRGRIRVYQEEIPD